MERGIGVKSYEMDNESKIRVQCYRDGRNQMISEIEEALREEIEKFDEWRNKMGPLTKEEYAIYDFIKKFAEKLNLDLGGSSPPEKEGGKMSWEFNLMFLMFMSFLIGIVTGYMIRYLHYYRLVENGSRRFVVLGKAPASKEGK